MDTINETSVKVAKQGNSKAKEWFQRFKRFKWQTQIWQKSDYEKKER
jgi:hypothetical protein